MNIPKPNPVKCQPLKFRKVDEGITPNPIAHIQRVKTAYKEKLYKEKLRVGFVNAGPTDLPSIRMRIQVVKEHLSLAYDDIECVDLTLNAVADGAIDVVVLGLPYAWGARRYGVPIIVDYPEDLLGIGSYLTDGQKKDLKEHLEMDQIKAIVVSSPKLLEQVPKGKGVCIPECAID